MVKNRLELEHSAGEHRASSGSREAFGGSMRNHSEKQGGDGGAGVRDLRGARPQCRWPMSSLGEVPARAAPATVVCCGKRSRIQGLDRAARRVGLDPSAVLGPIPGTVLPSPGASLARNYP